MAEYLVVTIQFPYIMEKLENQHPAKAATIVNLQQGLTIVLEIIVAHFADSNKIRLFNVIFFATVSYTMVSPSVLFLSFFSPLHLTPSQLTLCSKRGWDILP